MTKPLTLSRCARRTVLGLAVAVSAALTPTVFAQPHGGHGSHGTPATNAAKPGENAETWTSAEVRRIDKSGKRLTLRHEPIKHLDMPGMTMVFRVQDEALLDRVKVGERVRFQVKQENDQYIVTAIEAERK